MFTKLVLKGYLPLKNKGVNEITLDKLGMFNIILGRNGYGKTSLMRQLNFYPPDNSAFDEEGYKEIEAVVNGKHYKLTTKTSAKRAVNHFYCDGVNLNKGMTSAAQKELVREHFGLTNEIKRVISGVHKGDAFSSLSPARRKQVLMDINPNDVSYVLGVYETLRQQHSYVKNALKYQRQRLATELQRQKEVVALPIDELTYEVKLLDTQIKEALILQGELKSVKHHDIAPRVRKLEKLLSDLLTPVHTPDYAPSYYVTLIERTTRQIQVKRHRLIEIETLLQSLNQRLNKVGKRTPLTYEQYHEKKTHLQNDIAALNHEIDQHVAVIIQYPFFQNVSDWQKRDFVQGIKSFITQLEKVKLATDDTLTANGFTQLTESAKAAEKNVNFLEKERDNLRHQLTHFDNATAIACPECRTTFKRGFEKFDKAYVEGQIAQVSDSLKKARLAATTLREKITANEPWYYSMKSLIEFIRYGSERHYLLDMIKYYDIGKQPADTLIRVLNVIFCHQTCTGRINEIQTALSDLETEYQFMQQFDVPALYREKAALSDEKMELEKALRRHNEEVKLWEAYLDNAKSSDLTYTLFTTCFDETITALVDNGFYSIKQAVDKRLNDLSPKRDEYIAQLMKANSLGKVVDSIAKEVDTLEKEERHLRYLVDTLSPTKGWIGHLMRDFLNALCANVNAMIKEVWTDPLVLLAPSMEEDNVELDYKFRVVTTNPEKPIADISECSGGEVDLIDFFILLTLIRYLKTSPLFMDEVGVTFDELHRLKFSHYISTQARLNNLPQVFMISHYVSQYGIFNNNDVNIIKLNTTGMKVPENANENVTIR